MYSNLSTKVIFLIWWYKRIGKLCTTDVNAYINFRKSKKRLKLNCIYLQADETIHFGNVGNESYFFAPLFINHVSFTLLLSYSFHARTINLHPHFVSFYFLFSINLYISRTNISKVLRDRSSDGWYCWIRTCVKLSILHCANWYVVSHNLMIFVFKYIFSYCITFTLKMRSDIIYLF